MFLWNIVKINAVIRLMIYYFSLSEILFYWFWEKKKDNSILVKAPFDFLTQSSIYIFIYKKITLASYNSETSEDIISSPLSSFSVINSEEFVISFKLKNKITIKIDFSHGFVLNVVVCPGWWNLSHVSSTYSQFSYLNFPSSNQKPSSYSSKSTYNSNSFDRSFMDYHETLFSNSKL